MAHNNGGKLRVKDPKKFCPYCGKIIYYAKHHQKCGLAAAKAKAQEAKP